MPTRSATLPPSSTATPTATGSYCVVTTLAGSGVGTVQTDGTGTNAAISWPTGVAVGSTGDVVVSALGNAIGGSARLITSGGVVSSFYVPGGLGKVNGIAALPNGNVFFGYDNAPTGNFGCAVGVYNLTGTTPMVNVAGSSTTCGNVDGVGGVARISRIEAMTYSAATGLVYFVTSSTTSGCAYTLFATDERRKAYPPPPTSAMTYTPPHVLSAASCGR